MKQAIQDLLKRGWLSHSETDHQWLDVFGMQNHPFQLLASSPAIFGRSSHSGCTPESIPPSKRGVKTSLEMGKG